MSLILFQKGGLVGGGGGSGSLTEDPRTRELRLMQV